MNIDVVYFDISLIHMSTKCRSEYVNSFIRIDSCVRLCPVHYQNNVKLYNVEVDDEKKQTNIRKRKLHRIL